jgi:rhodanese-related sulfurtransferase
VSVPEIDVDELARRLAAGGVVVDVREPDEFGAGHVDGALLIPLADLAERVGELASTAPVHVICRSGPRSMRAAAFLAEHGFEAVNVEGGMMAWMLAGHPVVTASQ